MRAGIDQAAGDQLAKCFPHRRARYLEAPRNVGLVQRGPRRQRAAHDFIR
jgi:hypothetical protein